jgi:hypothetical protein
MCHFTAEILLECHFTAEILLKCHFTAEILLECYFTAEILLEYVILLLKYCWNVFYIAEMSFYC